MKAAPTPWVIGVLGLLVPIFIAVRLLVSAGWDPTVMTAFGEDFIEINEYAEEKLGREVIKRAAQGHDGKFFFVQANDPFLIDTAENAVILDRPKYRSQRMLYPVVAGGGGIFSPDLILWTMLIVNLLALGIGTWVVAALAVEMGGSPWWGLAFALNLGFISEMSIGGAGIVAASAAFGAVIFFLRGKNWLAVALLLAAALSREAMLIAAAGSAWWLWRRDERRTALTAILVPAAGVGLWAVYLRLRLGWDSGVSEVQEIGLPFAGFIDAAGSWSGNLLNLAVGASMLILFVLYARRTLVANELVGWAFLGFVILGVMFTEQVWTSYFDITRAVAPVITGFVLLVFVRNEKLST